MLYKIKDSIKNLINYLDGKKTFIIAALAVVDGLYQYYVEHGHSRQALVNYLLLGGGLAAMRSAINGVK